MNRAQEIAKIMATYEPGQVWEYRYKGTDNWYQCAHTDVPCEPGWDWVRNDYRRKPEPTLREWELDEVPLDAWFQHMKTAHLYQVTAVTEARLRLGPWECGIKPGELKDHYLHSTDGRKTWLPCGVLVPAN